MNEIEAVGAEVLQLQPGTESSADARPWLYSLLIAPSAVVANGVIQGGVLAYLLSLQGVGSGRQSHIIGLLALPTSIYFLWSPITDFLVRRRTWLLIGGPAAALLMVASFHQTNLSSSGALVLLLLSACFGQLAVSSCGGMMGAMSSERVRQRASSFYQAGSMGFGALAAWMLVWLSSRTSRDTLGLVAGLMIGVPALFALAVPPQETIATDSAGATIRRIGREFKATFLRWEALPYIACMTFPMASGAAIGLLGGVARQYGVAGDGVAWMNGLAGGMLMAAGASAVALRPANARASVAYLSISLVNAVTLCVLWLGPLRPSTYYFGVTLYLFTIGICYAMFTAVVLEFLGHSGKSGSGRYSIINSLGNVPVLYMLQLDGWGGDKWGARGLAGTEAVVGGIGGTLLLGYFLTRGRQGGLVKRQPDRAN
jgi:MFS transporter, PAT family, beta-lactamase induction signal transducer AmpG